MTLLEYVNDEILYTDGFVQYGEEECLRLIIESHRYLRGRALEFNAFKKSLTGWQKFCLKLADINLWDY